MDNFLEIFERMWEISFIRAVVYLLVALAFGWFASFAVRKLLKLIIPKNRQQKWEERGSTAIKLTGKLIFLIVFLLFLPSVLEALGVDSVTDPITDFVSAFISYIPNIIAAAILIFIGIFLGQVLEEVVSALLMKTKLDELTKKLNAKGNAKGENTGSDDETELDTRGISISSIIGKTVNGAVVLISIVEALTVLNIEAVSVPALSIIDAVFGVIPSIILAVIVIALGLVIANIACALLKNILSGINLDSLVKKMLPGISQSFSLTTLAVNVVRIIIILFVVAEGVDILGLTVLSGITAVIISYLPMVIKALVIAIAALYGASLLETAMSKTSFGKGIAVKILKTIIYVVAVFMVLSQLEFATTIVNYAFIITLTALAVAFAIAFGIGGRDFAKKTLDKVNISSQNSSEGNENN